MGSTHFPPSDRRQHRRRPLSAPVLLDLGAAWRNVPCRDISVGGLSVEVDLLPVGSTVEVYVELPSRVAIEARAAVVRSSNGTSALRFMDLEPELATLLESYCRTRGHRVGALTVDLAVPERVVLS